jgi:hypothetical protein
MASVESNTVTGAGIHVSSRGFSSIENGRAVAFVPRDEIQRIVLRYGRTAPRPIGQLVVGTVLVIAGLFPAKCIINWFTRDHVIVSPLFYLVALMPVGVYQMFTAFKTGYLLEVTTRRGCRKLALNPKAAAIEIDTLVHDAQVIFGDRIERDSRWDA